MKDQRRRLPKVISSLEMLDDRIVPSMLGAAPRVHAAMVAHHTIHANVHHARGHHARMLRLATQTSTGQAVTTSTPTAVAVTPSTPAAVTVAPSNPTPASSSVPVSGGSGGATGAFFFPTGVPTTTAVPSSEPTVPLSVNDVKVGPLAKAGQDLIRIYRQYLQQGAGFTPSAFETVMIQGTSVKIDAHTLGDVSGYASALAGLGMRIESQDQGHGTIPR